MNIQNNKEIVIIAVTQSGNSLRYASNALKDDEKIVSAAVVQHGAHCWAFKYISNRN